MSAEGSDDRYDFFDPWTGEEESGKAGAPPRWRPVRTPIPSPWNGVLQIPAVAAAASESVAADERARPSPPKQSAAPETVKTPEKSASAETTGPKVRGPAAALGEGTDGPSVEGLAAVLAGLPMPPLAVPPVPPAKLTRVPTVLKPEASTEIFQEAPTPSSEVKPGIESGIEAEPVETSAGEEPTAEPPRPVFFEGAPAQSVFKTIADMRTSEPVAEPEAEPGAVDMPTDGPAPTADPAGDSPVPDAVTESEAMADAVVEAVAEKPAEAPDAEVTAAVEEPTAVAPPAEAEAVAEQAADLDTTEKRRSEEEIRTAEAPQVDPLQAKLPEVDPLPAEPPPANPLQAELPQASPKRANPLQAKLPEVDPLPAEPPANPLQAELPQASPQRAMFFEGAPAPAVFKAVAEAPAPEPPEPLPPAALDGAGTTDPPPALAARLDLASDLTGETLQAPASAPVADAPAAETSEDTAPPALQAPAPVADAPAAETSKDAAPPALQASASAPVADAPAAETSKDAVPPALQASASAPVADAPAAETSKDTAPPALQAPATVAHAPDSETSKDAASPVLPASDPMADAPGSETSKDAAPAPLPTSDPMADPAGFLRDLGVPIVHAVTTRLESARHRTAVQDLLDLEPPSLRLVVWPRRGPMDPADRRMQATLEFVVEEDEGFGVTARYWSGRQGLEPRLQSRRPPEALRGEWVSAQVMDFLARTLHQA